MANMISLMEKVTNSMGANTMDFQSLIASAKKDLEEEEDEDEEDDWRYSQPVAYAKWCELGVKKYEWSVKMQR